MGHGASNSKPSSFRSVVVGQYFILDSTMERSSIQPRQTVSSDLLDE